MSSLNPEKALIFRIVHRGNIPWILDNGLHSSSSETVDPRYVSIGNPDLIGMRRHRVVPLGPGGTLADYVPFYFTPHSIMLLNIKTGFGGIPRVANEDIVILVSSLHKVHELGIPFVFTNQHAYPVAAEYFDALDKLGEVDWELIRSRSFQHDPEDPGKKERYQAEALVYRRLPVTGLIGMGCYNQNVAEGLQRELSERKLELQVVVKPTWYF